jgi:hypothetical protein
MIESVHASPSKASDNTLKVKRDDCPPCVPGIDINWYPQDLPDASVTDGCVPGLDINCYPQGFDAAVRDAGYCQRLPNHPDCIIY